MKQIFHRLGVAFLKDRRNVSIKFLMFVKIYLQKYFENENCNSLKSQFLLQAKNAENFSLKAEAVLEISWPACKNPGFEKTGKNKNIIRKLQSSSQ